MRRVYLDTIGLLALWNARDQWHEPAVRALAELTAGGAAFWTSTYIPWSAATRRREPPFRESVVELRQHLLDDGKLVEPTEDDCG